MTEEQPTVRPLQWLRSLWQSVRALPAIARWGMAAGAVVAVALLGLVVTSVVIVRQSFPQTSGTVALPGLSGKVEVVRDEHGIPQIYADSIDDLMMGQGYVHAQERFYEMDVRRHLTSGRLAEMFGPSALESDKFIRTLGWRRVAERELALVDPETRTALEAYADGVNAYLDSHDPDEMALEYTMLSVGGLDYTPEKWTPADSLAWLKAMAWDLNGNMDDEIARVLIGVNHTPREVQQLYPRYPYARHQPIVTSGAVVDGGFDQDAKPGETRNPERLPYSPSQRRALARLGHRMDQIPTLDPGGDGVGSNSWVVDGGHTTTGEPILANDPHLGVSLPGVWMQMGLHCREVTEDCPFDVSGFTFSGVPGVVIGHNADIAWGFTNLGPDVSDLFLERIRGRRWRYDGHWRPLRIRHETIKVAGGPDFELTVRETDHGPLLSDVSPELSSVAADSTRREGYSNGVALSWTGLQPAPTLDALLGVDAAGDWPEFRAAAADLAVPGQNLVYADRDGHIGYQGTGVVPIRKSGNDGSMPSAGWRPENDWTGESVPFDALPTVLDPDPGMIVAANQAVVGPRYPYYLTDSWDRGYRSARIWQLLSRDSRLSVADMAEIQTDDRNPMAPVVVPYLLRIDDLGSDYDADGRDLLVDWDFGQPADSAAAAYYNAVWSNILRLTFHDELRESLWPDGGQRWYGVMEWLLVHPRAAWWDDRTTDDLVEDRDHILREAMRDARDELTRRLSLNPDEWEWGRLHTLDLHNPTLGESGVAIVSALVNRDGYLASGGTGSVDATSWNAAEGYQVENAPSMRMVVSLADLDASRWVSLTGVSGHAYSGDYVDQTDLWVAGETLPWPSSADAVHAAADEVLTLVPAPENE